MIFMNNAKDKKIILVTGGAGFIGSHLCERLYSLGHRVISLDNYYAGSPENHISGVEYVEGHTKDIATLIHHSPDLVYHLGEYARVEKSFEDVEDVWDLNKTGTFAVLEFCRAHSAKLVYAGSSTKFSDEGAGRDQSPYAWTKATNTELVKNYGAWYGLEYAITYFYNVFGGRERGVGPYATLIGIFKEEYKKGNPLTVVLPGTQKRNFTHVDDIVDALVLVGEKGSGDDYGIGNETAYSVMDVALLFGTPVVMLPERMGNRMSSAVDTLRTKALGWSAKKSLADDIADFVRNGVRESSREQRIIVLSTTFHPVAGRAELALEQLMKKMPSVHFDVITSRLTKTYAREERFAKNVTVYRVGRGNSFDKFLLPLFGAKKVRALMSEHSYLFIWSLLASYAALAGVLAKKRAKLPLLITLGDQRIANIPFHIRIVLKFILGKADQIYASNKDQERHARLLGRTFRYSSTLGSGDAFANQIRFVYTNILEHIK